MSYEARTDPDQVIDGSICENSAPVDPRKDIVMELVRVSSRPRSGQYRIVLPETITIRVRPHLR